MELFKTYQSWIGELNMTNAEFRKLIRIIKQVDAFQVPIKVTINIFLNRERELTRETKIKEFTVNFVEEAIDEIRNYLLDRIEVLDALTINYSYTGGIKARGIRFMIANVTWGDVKPYGRLGKNQKVTVQVIIEKK